MDLAQTLVRSVARAFYTSDADDQRFVLVIDALVLHSALRDDDLGHLIRLNVKDTHKLCGKLRDERFLIIHQRQELKEGQQKPSSRTYYYIDYRQAVDAIKWRVYQLDKRVQGNAVPAQEKKEYFCTHCKAEWTQMEVLDNMDPIHGFKCHRCGSILNFDPDRQAGGHEQSTRLNNQLRFITDLLPKLDAVTIPNVDFDTALAAARPVVHDPTHQVKQSHAVESITKPAAVRGMANTGPTSIAISITDSEGPTEAEKEAERARKAKSAAANELPEWHQHSTISRLPYSGTGNLVAAAEAEEDVKKLHEPKQDTDSGGIDDPEFWKRIEAEQAEKARRQAEEDEEEEEEEDEDEDEDEEEEFVDTGNMSAVGEKRAASSGITSAADTPAPEERPSKKVKVEQPANDAESEDDEDVAFEDV
ncbi:hypothetical protein F4779DRAFT_601240 [Xylariaceae sp. FL0662B]|nr:hypothetical protein F4779DRAFT_601240 [Xylariaceae sp. FL0662B]